MIDLLIDGQPTRRGVTGQCPFCLKDSTSRSPKFLVCMDDEDQFSWFNCFRCQAKGTGRWGLKKLATARGQPLNFLDTESLATQRFRPNPVTDRSPVISWPPAWADCDDDLRVVALDYMERLRGVKNPAAVARTQRLVFSYRILADTKLVEYPCILAPMADAAGEVIGYSSRKIDGISEWADKVMPKSIAMAGADWKKESMFGGGALIEGMPVVITEGLFDALNSPNAVCLGGKHFTKEHVSILKKMDSSCYIFALDPDVSPKLLNQYIFTLQLACADALVTAVNWPEHGTAEGADPGSLGMSKMLEIIKKELENNISAEPSS